MCVYFTLVRREHSCQAAVFTGILVAINYSLFTHLPLFAEVTPCLNYCLAPCDYSHQHSWLKYSQRVSIQILPLALWSHYLDQSYPHFTTDTNPCSQTPDFVFGNKYTNFKSQFHFFHLQSPALYLVNHPFYYSQTANSSIPTCFQSDLQFQHVSNPMILTILSALIVPCFQFRTFPAYIPPSTVIPSLSILLTPLPLSPAFIVFWQNPSPG